MVNIVVCPECGSNDITEEDCDDGDIGGVQYWDTRIECKNCKHVTWESWTEPGTSDD